MSTSLSNKLKVFLYGILPYSWTRITNPSSPKLTYYKFFMRHGYTHYPYEFAKKYLERPVLVLRDEKKGLPYVVHGENKRLYFPKDYSCAKIEKNYKALLIEQDKRHPHHYVDSMTELADKTLFDIGAAEGFTSLDSIEVTKSVYLFEYDDKWIEALKATFEPWKDKVRIIKKFIGNQTNDSYETIDRFIQGGDFNNVFLKMDIEGNERDALAASTKLFTQTANLNFAICTYHKKDDAEKISAYLNRLNCDYSFTDGYMFVRHKFRKGLIRGKNKCN